MVFAKLLKYIFMSEKDIAYLIKCRFLKKATSNKKSHQRPCEGFLQPLIIN